MKTLLCLLLLLGSFHLAAAATIEGRVVRGEDPMPGMQVRAYSDLNPARAPLGEAVLTDQQGLFTLDLAPGFVALYATSADGRYFAFCGRNPLQARPEQKLWAGLQAVAVTPPVFSNYDDEYTAGLEGVVTFNNKPVPGAYVSLYLDVAEDLKGQGYRISAPTDDEGYFAFDGLPESSYFLVARKRHNGSRVGPLAEGDMLGVYAGNPLNLKAGKMTKVALPLVVRQPSQQQVTGPDRPGTIQLQGRVLDEEGRPLAGLYVFAYRNPVIGHQRPAAQSAQTAADGHFVISFQKAGVYYLGAREIYGDSPAPGELFGLYEGRADHGLQIRVGDNADIEIRVAPISLD